MHIWFIFIFVRFLNLSLNLLLYFAFKLVEEKELGRIAVEILLATILQRYGAKRQRGNFGRRRLQQAPVNVENSLKLGRNQKLANVI